MIDSDIDDRIPHFKSLADAFKNNLAQHLTTYSFITITEHCTAMSTLLSRTLPLGSAIASGIAILISIKSCQISNNTYDLASTEYIQERSLLLTAEFSDNNNSIRLKPTNNEITLLIGSVIFPSRLHDSPIPVSSSGELWGMGSLIPNLQDYALEKAPRETGFTKLKTSTTPIIINSYYIAKGDTYTDHSLYLLKYDTLIYEDPDKQPTIHFRGLLFVLRESQQQKIDTELLNKVENKEMFIKMPYGPPSLQEKK